MSPQLSSRVIHGDCIQVMRRMPAASVDFVLTDPPYLVNYRPRSGQRVANDNDDAWLKPAFAEIYRLLKPDTLCVSFYGWNSAEQFLAAWREAGFRIVGHIVFAKPYAASARYVGHQHEQAYVLAKGRPEMPAEPISDVQGWTYSGNRNHPTEKAVEVLTPLIAAFTKPGDVVLDPFCGSGSTLVAAKQAGHETVGIELDRSHHRIAQRRVEGAGRGEVTIRRAAHPNKDDSQVRPLGPGLHREHVR
jgi:site-specific DNA-methyltransferase (adenine-specific)